MKHNATPNLFEEPQETLIAHAERLDAMARALVAEVGKFRDRLNAGETAAAPPEPKPHPIKGALTYFDYMHKRKFNGTPAKIDGGKDASIIKRLLDTYGEDRVRDLIAQFFDEDDPFVVRAGYTVGMFSSRVAGLISSSSMPVRARGVTANTQPNERNGREAVELIQQQYGGRR